MSEWRVRLLSGAVLGLLLSLMSCLQYRRERRQTKNLGGRIYGSPIGSWMLYLPLWLLMSLGIAEYDLDRPVLQLSGGQQQRVAMARAISYEPPIILADEPTGNLDERTEREIMAIFKDMAHRAGKCVIIVTHSKQIAAQADERIAIEDLNNRKKTVA